MNTEVSIEALNNIHQTIKDNQSLLSTYFNEIKNLSEYNQDSSYDLLKNDLESMESKLIINKKIEPFKDIIVNILKTLLITKTRIDSSDNVMQKLLDDIEDKDTTIKSLKQYILKHQEILKANNLKIPKYEPLNLSLQSNLKSSSALTKRLSILNNKNNSTSINKWLQEIEYNKLVEIPNDIIKKASKEVGINIKVTKEEKNKVLKQSD